MPNIFSSSLLFAFAMLGGCSSAPTGNGSQQQALAQMATPFSQGAISIMITADPDLNAVHGMANSCTLLIVQAQKVSTLNKLLSNPFAVKALFSDAGAQNDILKVDRYSAMPGQNTTLHIDRSENARYFAIIAGYYPFPQKQHMLLVSIPVKTEKSGWLHPVWQTKLSPLSLSLRLGSKSITQFGETTPMAIPSSDGFATGNTGG